LILSVFFVGNIDASIYESDATKNDFIITPGMIAYQNGLNSPDGIGGSDFRVKDNIVLPAYSVVPGEEEKTSFDDVKKKDRISYYIVQAGDNVAKIAKKFGVSKDTII
jgi:LysM repeat protein